MNLSNLFPGLPQPFWAEVVCLGRVGEWLRIERDDESERPRSKFHVDRKLLSRADLVFTRKLVEKSDSGLFLTWMDTVAKLSASGVRMFRPSMEQCESMEHVELNLPISSYRQPFPCMVIEFPEEYRRSLRDRTGREPPRHIVTQHRQDIGMFFSGCSLGFYEARKQCGYHDELLFLFLDRPQFATIEDALAHDGTVSENVSAEIDAKRKVLNEACTRVAMNLCMLLADVPLREAPSDRKLLDRLKKDNEANRVERATHVNVVRPMQDIIVRKHETTGTSDPTGLHVAPHWRRGHWRNQHFGVSNSQIKRVFIRPVLVNASRHDGSTIDTVYRDPAVNAM